MDAFWAAVNRPKLAPKKSKFRQKKLYLTTVDVEDVASAQVLDLEVLARKGEHLLLQCVARCAALHERRKEFH